MILPMAQRIRDAGDQAVPMLQDIQINASAQLCQALLALEHGNEGGPDVSEARRRVASALRLLLTGEG